MGKKILEENKKITCKEWIEYIKQNNINAPVGIHCIKTRFSIDTWSEFVNKCRDYNHKIKKFENLDDVFECYDIQVEGNNNFAVITKETKNIHSGIIVHNCGDVMKLSIEVDKNGIIQQSKFKTFGCGSAIAASSIATELIKGKNIEDALKIKNVDIATSLKLPPVKLHCSMLAEDAIKSAIDNYKKKNI